MKTRFSPSPTGHMHLGNARTALFSYLLGKHSQATFLLRIEDTDKSRSDEELANELMIDLRWMGIIWNEGPGIEGDNAPYWQSQRQTIYNKYYQQLIDNKLAYPCFCSDAQLTLHRKVQMASGKPPRYPGTCRNLTEQQIQQKLSQGLQATLRFAIPDNTLIEFNDIVRGQQTFKSDDIGDFIIRRADGSASFMFCNAVDDALMGTTDVIRGEDHLTNTPRQILILQALALPIPRYGHISLITAPGGKPLSKREGSKSIKQLREMGYLSIAVVNYLARLGHSYSENNLMPMDELAKAFNPAHLSKSPAGFDPEQLLYWQREAIQQMSLAEIKQWLGDSLQQELPKQHFEAFIAIIKPNITFPDDAAFWAKQFFAEQLSYEVMSADILKQAGIDYFSTALDLLADYHSDYKNFTQALKEKLNVKGKELFMPLRVALTGQTKGPELASTFELLSEKQIAHRFQQALHICKQ